jgi:hypothetical protein
MNKKYGWLLLLLLPVSSLALGKKIDETYDTRGADIVYLENRAGSVTVRGWDRDEVSVGGALGDAQRIEWRVGDRRLIVRAVYSSSWLSRLYHSVRPLRGAVLEIYVPHNKALVVNAVGADITTSGVSGSQRLASVGGDLHASLEAGAGAVVATTISGDIRIAGTLGASAELQSASGDIAVRAEAAPGSEVHAATASGDVTLLFRGEAMGRYALDTTSGHVDTCFGTASRRVDSWGVERVRFVEGGAGATVRVSTASGDVAVCRT